MKKYRKKPVVIEAMVHEGPTPEHARYPDALKGEDGLLDTDKAYFDGEKLCIVTLEGTMQADPGDFIIVGVKGEVYPCKPDIFEATYDEVD